jgi:hypothetical protein
MEMFEVMKGRGNRGILKCSSAAQDTTKFLQGTTDLKITSSDG